MTSPKTEPEPEPPDVNPLIQENRCEIKDSSHPEGKWEPPDFKHPDPTNKDFSTENYNAMQTTFTRSFLAMLLMAVPCFAIEAGTYAISCETINRDNQTYLRRGYILIVSADGSGRLLAPNHNLAHLNGGGEDSSPKITSLEGNRGFAITSRFKDAESSGDPSKGVIKSDCLLNLSFDEQGFGGGSEVTESGCEVIRARINKIPNVEQAGRGDGDKPSN